MIISFKDLIMSIAVVVLYFMASNGVLAAGDPMAGKSKANICVACHGPNGNSIVDQFPKLAGQHSSYLVKQLADFQSGKRKDATMAGFVANLSNTDMVDLGAFFAQQTIQVGKANVSNFSLGEKIYRGGLPDKAVAACMGCHGPNGIGNPAASFPAVGGQHATYVVKTLKDFKSETRTNDNDMGKVMQRITANMSDAEIEAVATYIQGLH